MKTNAPSYFKFLLCCLLILSLSVKSFSQSVGVVLSGGGASGMAHVGFLKALEENNIPIDYIVGTSAGALVASLYASGYSPQEIQDILISEKFLLMSTGEIEDENKFYFKKLPDDASLVTIDFSKDFSSESFLPANYISPNLLDFELMRLLNQPQANYNDFDSLFIPFRCVASDVLKNRPIVFRNGTLNEVVRASMTYPFYMKPIKVDGKYMYDGGIYNNFPSDIIYGDFMPDVIIGCNLSDTLSLEGNDFLTQLKSIILNRKENDIVCENGIIVKPSTSVGTFDFKGAPDAVRDGYIATIQAMDSIKALSSRRTKSTELDNSRKKYTDKYHKQIIIDSIEVTGVKNQNTKAFIKKSLLKSKTTTNINDLKKDYFRLIEDANIQHIFPKLTENPKTGNYILNLAVSLNKELSASFGGIFSSSPINTGFIGFKYKHLGKTSKLIDINSYFGKVYGSVNGTYRMDFPSSKLPVGFSVSGGINRWDFFRSYATFFEESKPSFIVINEYYSSLSAHVPITNSSLVNLTYNNFFYENDYYQTENFSLSDTADLVKFFGSNFKINLVKSTTNEKLFPSKGILFSFSASYTQGKERFIPGSTSLIKDNILQDQQWIKLSYLIDKYFHLSNKMSFGIFHETVLTSSFQFSNYFSTQLFTTQFSPIEQLRVRYTNDLRSNNYTALGVKHIYSIKPKIQLRNEGYLFTPIISVRNSSTNQPIIISKNFLSYLPIIKSSIVLFTPVGPVSFSGSYIFPEKNPFLFQLNFGYIIHNRKILD